MADLSGKRQSAAEQLAIAPIRVRNLTIEAVAPCVRYILRGSEGLTLAAPFGVDLPRQACHANISGHWAALWLGPDEWLLICSDPACDSLALEAALTVAHSLVDVSHRQSGFALSGRLAATVLNAGCPLDLSLEAFPTGMCTRTIFGKAEIVLWRTEEHGFRMEVARSFVGYAAGFLEVAAQDAVGKEGSRQSGSGSRRGARGEQSG
jgi:sarcosine oxidase subunit gamma